MTGTVRILSIDGGGIRGVIPALVLDRLEYLTERRTYALFDLIAGTSTGAILAAGLTRPIPYPASRMADLYMTFGEDIFSSSPIRAITSALSGPKYDPGPLYKVLDLHLGDVMLSECLTNLLIPCYDLERRSAKFFKSWRAAGRLNPATELPLSVEYGLQHVVRAATAAPTYFPPALVHSATGERLAAVDGAIFANNPSLCALAEARVLYPQADRYILVSLGVGEFRKPIAYENAKGWGALSWAQPVIDSAMDGSADTVDYQLRELVGPAVEYHRFQIDLNGPNGPSDCIDDASDRNIAKLINRAQALIAENGHRLGRLAKILPQIQPIKTQPSMRPA